MTTSSTAEPADRVREHLRRDGFCAVGALVPGAILAEAHAVGVALLEREGAESRRALRSLGSLISVFRDEAFLPLLEAAGPRSLLAQVGGGELRLAAGYFLSKPGRSPATFWHQDWGFWGEASSYGPRLAEVGVLIYLVDVDESNGCPRFLPGTHRRRHPLHALLAATEVAALRRADDPASPAYQEQPGAVAVPVRAGEAVLFDPRVLHGACANRTDAERPALVLWYFLDLEALDPSIRAFMADGDPVAGWSAQARARVAPLLPAAMPGVVKATLTKHPDERLR